MQILFTTEIFPNMSRAQSFIVLEQTVVNARIV